MIVLKAEAIRKHYGPEPVLSDVTFDVHPGDRIGLVGPNGTGKTTLLKILSGKEEADAGLRELHPSLRMGYLEQQPELIAGRTLWDEAHDALAELVALQHEAVEVAHRLAATTDTAEHRRLAARYDHLQQELHRHDAYNLDHKVERVLEGLGFRQAAFELSVESLSGGEQNRLMLAKLLLADPDVMLLDEPSNHLDIEATEWLEDYLAGSRAAMIVVSHDRYFLDKVTNRTLELFHGSVESYTGNFSAYWQQKGERLLVQRRTYERQQQEIEKTKDFIRRNSYGQKHAQAEDRRKKLVRMEEELVSPPREIAAPPMAFPPAERSGDIVLRAEHATKSYDRPLFTELTFDVIRGQRWAILGPNGTGKSTLLKSALGLIDLDGGQIHLGQGVKVGYFDQQLQGLDDNKAVVDAIRPDFDMNEPQRRSLLARFGITGDTAMQNVSQLSGGERCRAALARLAASAANFLVLDEPTNHLDLWARDALEQALKAFDGTVLFVSHDRYFVNRVADHLLVVEPGRFRVIEGNYSTWLHFVREGLAAGDPRPRQGSDEKTRSAGRGEKPSERSNRQDKQHPAAAAEGASKPKPKRRFPYRKAADIEVEIAQREANVEDLHRAMTLPENLRDGDRVKQLKAQLDAEQETLQGLYAHWEEASELNW